MAVFWCHFRKCLFFSIRIAIAIKRNIFLESDCDGTIFGKKNNSLCVREKPLKKIKLHPSNVNFVQKMFDGHES